MAAFKIHVDEEIVPQLQENKPKGSKAVGKRCVLGQITNNHVRDSFKTTNYVQTKAAGILPRDSSLSTGFTNNIKALGFKDKNRENCIPGSNFVKSPLKNNCKENDDKVRKPQSPMSIDSSSPIKFDPKENNYEKLQIPIIDTTPVRVEEKSTKIRKEVTVESPMSVDASPRPPKHSESIKSDLEELFGCETYKEDIYKYLRKVEEEFRPKAYYMRRQPEVSYSMRTLLVDWLVEVGEEYKLKNETLFMTVSFIDRFLSSMAVAKPKLQLLGTSAMFIASKFEEIYPPEVGEFTYITADTYTVKQVLRMERLILKVLSFDLSCPTSYTFIMHISSSTKLPSKIVFLAMYICELTLLEADPYLSFNPSLIASGAIALARHCLNYTDVWPCNMAKLTGYSYHQLSPIISHLNDTHNRSFTLPQKAIRQKYSVPEYEGVSKIPFKRLITRDTTIN